MAELLEVNIVYNAMYTETTIDKQIDNEQRHCSLLSNCSYLCSSCIKKVFTKKHLEYGALYGALSCNYCALRYQKAPMSQVAF